MAALWGTLFLVPAPATLAQEPPGLDPSEQSRAGSQGLKSTVPFEAQNSQAPETTTFSATQPPPILATLLQTHTRDLAPLDATWPDAAAISDLLVDHVLDERHPIAPELFGLLRTLAGKYPQCRFEIVSGFRSEKRNEAMRKKGHHVAAHSQHSLGTAIDFRVIPAGSTTPVDPLVLEKQLRDLGWNGGIGVYLAPGERFVHADVGKNRRWRG